MTIYLEDFRSNPFEFFKDPTGWLYSDWTEDKFKAYSMLNSLPFVGNYMDYLLDKRATDEYFDRYGMDYTDIHDPRKLQYSNTVVNLYRSGMNFVSKNVTRLYR